MIKFLFGVAVGIAVTLLIEFTYLLYVAYGFTS